jgi:WD40 repeat protein
MPSWQYPCLLVQSLNLIPTLTFTQLSAICFDKNERRLVTAGSDGSVFMWNFNNGSLLKEFRHSEEKEELTAVLFVADEKRESDAVYAAGWNAKVRREQV